METEKRNVASKGLTTAIKSKCVNIVVEEGVERGRRLGMSFWVSRTPNKKN
jgi:hypothetical protein